MSENILLLDLGGTNLRVGLGNKELKSIHKISKQKIDSNEELYEIIGDVVRDSKSSEIVTVSYTHLTLPTKRIV